MKDNPILIERLLELEKLLQRYYGHGKHKYCSLHPKRGQSRILSILKLKPEIPQKELAFMLDMRKQSLGELLAKLEDKGFITRTPAPGDQRAMIVKLTPLGTQAASEIDLKSKHHHHLFSCFTEEEQNQFENYLNRLIKSIKKEIKEAREEDDRNINC